MRENTSQSDTLGWLHLQHFLNQTFELLADAFRVLPKSSTLAFDKVSVPNIFQVSLIKRFWAGHQTEQNHSQGKHVNWLRLKLSWLNQDFWGLVTLSAYQVVDLWAEWPSRESTETEVANSN